MQSLDSLPLPPIKSNHTDLEIKSLDSTSITSNSWGYASFPVENFQRYTSPFGKRINPVTRKAQFHTGLDLAAPFGAYVRAWWGGQVVKLTSDKGCGIGITIASGSWQHVYCHLIGQVKRDRAQTYLVDREGGIILKLGQSVTTGAIIARVGMTGSTTGPHLHWGLKFNGNWVDPALILEQMYQEQKYSSAGTRTLNQSKT